MREHVDLLSNEQAGILLKNLLRYSNTGEVIETEDIGVKMLFSVLRSQIDRDSTKYERIVEKRKQSGRMGGLAKAKQNIANVASAKFAKQTVANVADNDTVTDTVNDNVNDNVTVNVNDTIKEDSKESKKGADKPTRFIPPTLSEVQKYISDNKYSVNASTFIDFYTAKGWMVGKNKMKDWKAAVRTWQNKDKQLRPEEVGIVLNDNSIDKYANDKLW